MPVNATLTERVELKRSTAVTEPDRCGEAAMSQFNLESAGLNALRALSGLSWERRSLRLGEAMLINHLPGEYSEYLNIFPLIVETEELHC